MDGRLRVELFVADVDRSVEFYRRVLGFEAGAPDASTRPHDYVAVRLGDAVIGIGRATALPEDHPVSRPDGVPVGRGVEIVLEVPDVRAAYERAERSGTPVASPLAPQPWGATDFRLLDPDGYYLRVTSR